MGGHGPDATTEIVDAQGTAVEENARAGIAAHSQGRARNKTARVGSEAGERMEVTITEGTARKHRITEDHVAGTARIVGEPETSTLALTDRRIGIG